MSSAGTILLGHPRSGTTLLRRLIGAHPAVCAPPETHLFGACARFLSAAPTADGVEMGVLTGLHFAGMPEDETLTRLRNLAFGMLDHLAHVEGAAQWVEKTAFDVFHLAGIEKLCGDRVRYLGLIRDPLDTATSCVEFCAAAGTYHPVLHEYIRRHPQPIEAFCHSWADATNALFDLGTRRTDQVLICRYEDLVADPDDTLADIFDFLDLDVVDVSGALTDLGRLGFSDHKTYRSSEVHQHSVGRSAQVADAQRHRLASLLNPLMEQCGYDPLEVSPADDAPEQVTATQRRRYEQSLLAAASTASATSLSS